MGVLSQIVQSYLQTLKSLNRNVWLWLFAWFGATGFTFFGIFMVVFNLYVVRLGYGTREVGLLMFVQTISLAVFSLPAGLLGTRFSVRKLTVIGLFITALSYLVFFFAPVFFGDSRMFVLLLGMIILGAGTSLLLTNALPLFTLFTQTHQRSLAFSLLAASEPLGGFVGSLVGGLLPGLIASVFGYSLADAASYRFALFLPVLVLIAAAFAILATSTDARTNPTIAAASAKAGNKKSSAGLLSEGVPEDGLRRSRLRQKIKILPIILILVLCLVSATRMQSTFFPRLFFNVYVEDVIGENVSDIGMALGLAQLVMVPVILMAPIFYRLLGKERSFVLGIFVSVLGAVFLAFVPSFAAATAAIVVINIGFGLSNVVFNQYIQEAVRPKLRAPVMGATILTQSIGMAIMNLVGGYFIPQVGYSGMFLVSAVVSSVAAFTFGVYFRKPRGEHAV